MRHLQVAERSASGVSRFRGRATPRLGLRVRTIRTDVPLIVSFPGLEPYGSGTEIHSGTPGTRPLVCSGGSEPRRCAEKAGRWVRAVRDSARYLAHRGQE